MWLYVSQIASSVSCKLEIVLSQTRITLWLSYTVRSNICGDSRHSRPCVYSWIVITSTLLGRFSTSIEWACGVCVHSWNQIGEWFCATMLGVKSVFRFIPMVFSRVEVRDLLFQPFRMSLCAYTCWNVLGPVNGKFNTTAYNDILQFSDFI